MVNTYNSDNYNYSWKVNYSENCFLPFTDSEIAMLNDVFVDNLDTYVLDKPNRALDIKDILRNRVTEVVQGWTTFFFCHILEIKIPRTNSRIIACTFFYQRYNPKTIDIPNIFKLEKKQ